MQSGKQDGNLSAYALFESAYDEGWRDLGASSSHLNRMYAAVGARNEQTEFHISFNGADNIFANVAATPLDLLNQKWVGRGDGAHGEYPRAGVPTDGTGRVTVPRNGLAATA